MLHFINEETINYVDGDGRSVLFHAILASSPQMSELLIKRGANVNLRDNKGWSPLHYAAQGYAVGIAKLLIEGGADLEPKDNYGNTPLWRATFSSNGKGDMIKFLISKGANPDTVNDSNVSPIKLAKTIANYDVKIFFE